MSYHRHSDRQYHAIADYSILIREAISEGYDWPTFQALTVPMQPEIKTAVWQNLDPEEKAYIQALKTASVPVSVAR